MSLSTIANSMKQRARIHDKTTEQMPRGAKLTLTWFTETQVFELRIERARKSKNASAPALWKTEVETFARAFGAVSAAARRITIHSTAAQYRAVVKWREADTKTTRYAHPLPQNADELAAWALTLGPGVKIRHVDVVTGEL